MHSLTARVIRNTSLYLIYRKLLVGEELSLAEQSALLQIAIILLNNDNPDTQSLGYRIIVLYSNHTSDYVPLYDIALNNGYIPVLKQLDRKEQFKEKIDTGFFNSFYSSLAENYRSGEVYYTKAQLELSNFFKSNSSENVVVVAPTSYGKSELFTDFCRSHPESKICILVPTKALLAQTKRRLLEGLTAADKRKIITHPEMYSDGADSFIAILTQERVLRLSQKHPTADFDYVFIDEAHNLLGVDQRSLLLAKVIVLLKHRNEAVAFKYLTPFLVDSKNISTRYTNFEIAEFKIEENLKTERFYCIDFRDGGALNIYDQYFDKFTPVFDESKNEIEFIKNNSAPKNIIYLNTPPKVELFVRSYVAGLPRIENLSIKQVCKNISEFLHHDYLLIDCLEKGAVYHHGSVPDVVKLYIEDVFSKEREIKHIVTTSTLLEGVNIPAQKLFMLDVKKGIRNLTKSQFKNLVGRICRFKEMFASESGDLAMLEPKVYLVGTKKYLGENANLRSFIKSHSQVDLSIKDQVENVLLKNSDLTGDNEEKKREADEYLENLAEGITGESVIYASTEIGRLCFLNNISEIDILFWEEQMMAKSDVIEPESIFDAQGVLLAISDIFIPYLKERKEYDVYRRLSQDSAQKFYAMFLNWRMRNASYAEMINQFLDYWNEVHDPLVYVGRWGNIAREGSWRENWTDIRSKKPKERVNLAIVRIKEEQDFLDNFILKFVEILYDMNKLENSVYLKIKYGTIDQRKISLINSGINSHLASLLIDKYSRFLNIDLNNNDVFLTPEIIDEMASENENEILIFEAKFHVR